MQCRRHQLDSWVGKIPGSGRSPGEGNGNPLQYSCLENPMDCGRKAPLSMEFSRQEYWSGLPVPSPGDLSNPGTEPRSPALQADSLLSEPPGKPAYKDREPLIMWLPWCVLAWLLPTDLRTTALHFHRCTMGKWPPQWPL